MKSAQLFTLTSEFLRDRIQCLRNTLRPIRLTALLGVVLFAATIFILWYSYSTTTSIINSAVLSATELSTEAAQNVKNEAVETAINQLIFTANSKAAQVKGELDEAFGVADTLARTLEGMKNADVAVDIGRDSVNSILRQVLVDNPEFSGVYTVWEPNAFDGLDLAYQPLKGFMNEQGHDATGRFIPYWFRDSDGKISLLPSTGYENEEKHVNGVRKGEYYTSPRNSGKRYFSNPYLRRLGAEEIWVTTISVPIKTENRFHGVVGVDLKLDNLQKLADELAAGLFDGSGKVIMVSNNGMLAAISGEPEYIGEPCNSYSPTLQKVIERLSPESRLDLDSDQYITVFMPLVIANIDKPWSIFIRVPKEDIEEDAIALHTEMMSDVHQLGESLHRQSVDAYRVQLAVGMTLILSIVCIIVLTRNLENKEHILVQQKEQYRTLIDNLTVGVYRTDGKHPGKFLQVNQALADILGYDNIEELMQQEVSSFAVTAEERQGVLEQLKQSGTSNVNNLEIRIKRRDGKVLWASFTARLQYNEDGSIRWIDGILEDISERKQVEKELDVYRNHLEDVVKKRTEELSQAKDAADSASRAKSEFIANMSHEIRTPLNAVTGYSELLSSLVTDQKQKNYIDAIKTAGKSLLTLLNDILDLSKIEANKLNIEYAPVNVRVIFTEIERIFQLKTVGKDLSFYTVIDNELPQLLMLDETRLRQVMLNIVGNAIKFTEDGHILLSVKSHIHDSRSDKLDLSISVTDTGIGIAESDLEKIFEVFEQQYGQSTRRYGGTGLGLPICKRLVEMMGGRIAVESVVGEGSTFLVHLKDVEIFSGEEPVMLSASFDVMNYVFDRSKVLIVDDVRSNRELLEELLATADLDVLSAENGQEAILIAEEYQPDAILMDIRMPVMNGIEASKKLMENPKTSSIPIIILTASARLEDKINASELKTQGYLTKPIKKEQLLACLAQYLPHSRRSTASNASLVTSDNENTIDSIECLPELRESLENKLIPEWSKLTGSGKMDTIKKFGNRVKDLGEHHNWTILKNYGSELIGYADDYDVSAIRISLKKFPGLIERLAEPKGGDNGTHQS